VIGTGATHVATWAGFRGWRRGPGVGGGAAALGEAGAMLVETFFYAAASRGDTLGKIHP
jgi:hypothetical protein